MAHRVRGFLRSAPVLLLTATPMQNSLAELWGLVQYVEPTGTLLGDIATFREVFCGEDDRTLVPGQEHELQRRLAMVLQRTLRRQAQEFLERPFTQRRCRLYEYAMSDDERSLYDDVTEYLLAAVAVRVRRPAAAAAADRVSPPHGVVDSGAGREPGERRRAAAPPRSGSTRRRRCDRDARATSRTRRRSKRPAEEPPAADRPRGASPRSWRASRASSRARGRFRTTPRRVRSRTRSGSFSSSARRARQRQGRRLHRVDHDAGVPANAAPRHGPAVTRTSPCFAASTITSARSRRSRAG